MGNLDYNNFVLSTWDGAIKSIAKTDGGMAGLALWIRLWLIVVGLSVCLSDSLHQSILFWPVNKPVPATSLLGGALYSRNLEFTIIMQKHFYRRDRYIADLRLESDLWAWSDSSSKGHRKLKICTAPNRRSRRNQLIQALNKGKIESDQSQTHWCLLIAG